MEVIVLQELFFFFDDSGVLHKNNPVKKFVYAGYVFSSRQELDIAKRKYRSLVKKIQKSLNSESELKAFGLENKHKRALYKVLEYVESLSVVVDVSKIYKSILESSKSVCRYKDYILKRVIKNKIRKLIDRQIISPNDEITLHIFIDEQMTATDGIYGLRETIKEELQHGIKNYDYGTFHQPLFQKKVFVEVKYCD